MVKKQNSRFVCTNCGAVYTAWMGRCQQCNEWNTLQEEPIIDPIASLAGGRHLTAESVTDVVSRDQGRMVSGIKQLDTVLGGGLVVGSVNLIAGQPGVGKSTLLLQLAYVLSKHNEVLYISGEESSHQIGLRAKRLGVDQPELKLATSSSADDIAVTISEKKFDLVIVDSIQTTAMSGLNSSPGSIAQISGSTQLLTQAAKQSATTLLLVGHVTKEGLIAGPKVMEHLVDVVLQLEGETYGGFKVLRASKNRYGSTNETGIFEMVETGLIEIENPSEALLAERQVTDGSIVLATMEGTRPLLVEIQALVNPTSYGYPRRAASGIDLNRLNLLVAVLERRTKLRLSDKDIYVNVVGGIRVSEPAADLAICMAIGSAAKGLQLKMNAVVFGEVGLGGEIRRVPYVEKRVAEAKKLGFDGVISPPQKPDSPSPHILAVQSLRDALNQFLEKT